MTISFFAGEPLSHIATPLEGASSWVREDGSPADSRRADHYPIYARCKACHESIWLGSQLQREWWHVPVKAAPPDPAAAPAPPGDAT